VEEQNVGGGEGGVRREEGGRREEEDGLWCSKREPISESGGENTRIKSRIEVGRKVSVS
jgi:hypothetical protein